MSKDKKENKTVSKALLESCRNALYKVKETFDDITSSTDFEEYEISTKLELAEKINKIVGGLGKSIETLAILEKKVESEEQEKSKRRGGVESSQFEE